MRTVTSLVLAASAVVWTLPALAQFAKPEDAVRYRKSAMFIMQQNLGRVAAMSAGRVAFDAKVAADSAVVAEFMSRLPWPAFGAGTDKGETRAKPEIWAEPVKFSEYAQNMRTEMSKLAVAAKAADLDSLKAAVNATGAACKTCHDAYRKD